MQYTKPLNETNLNAGYRDAVPAQGIKGSTVPASAIEAPQREIVNVISSAGLTPSAADNTQLTQAIDGKINAAKEGKADVDLSNSPYTTNRILEIPQNIKLELNNGTLTLKAGSKVYVPNGFEDDGVTPKFDEVTTTENVVQTNVSSTTRLMFLKNSTTFGASVPGTNCFSGDTSPTHTGYAYWYDTANNIIRYDENTGTWDAGGYSLPLGIRTADGTNVTFIDQVFNGFGYIGSTAFVLPGVKVQQAAGFENGVPSSEIQTVENVVVFQAPGASSSYDIYLRRSDGVLLNRNAGHLCFDAESNAVVDDEYPNAARGIVLATYTTDANGSIASFQPCFVDFAANADASNFSSSGKRAIVGWGSPDYTAAVDYTSNWGSVITTQKRGWLWVRGNAYAGSTPVYLTIGTVSFNVMENGATSSGTGSGAFFRIPPTQFQVTGGNGYARQILFFPCMGA